MTNRQEAILITESFIKDSEEYKDCIVNLENILEQETLWWVPFKEKNFDPALNIILGAYYGLIIDKGSKEYFQPSTGPSLEEWMDAFKMGLIGKRYDLLIIKVNNQKNAIEVLEKLGLSYVKIEIEYGTEWKIPKEFNRKQIKKRLEKLPCIFKNQSFTGSTQELKRIRNERIFEYQLLKTENKDPRILGELI